MTPADWYQLGYFGLLLLLAHSVKGWIDSSSKKCEETTALLATKLEASHGEVTKILTTTVAESTAARDRHTVAIDKLSTTMERVPCMWKKPE